MKNISLLLILLLVVFGTIGCRKNISIDHIDLGQSETKVVKEVIIHNPPQNVTSPSEAVIHQYEVVFENHKSEYPEKKSIISETSLGNKSIVAIRSPEGSNIYSVFLYNFVDEWIMDSHLIFDVLEENLHTDKEELALPIDQFNAVSMNINDNEQIWAFANEDVVMTIAVFNHYLIPESSKVEKMALENGTKSFISKDQYQNNYLYYYDMDKIVVVSGNVSRSEIIELANTIPSVTAANFPSNK